MQNLIEETHHEWHDILSCALKGMDPDYLRHLQNTNDWLPGNACIFNAFHMPLSSARYLLFGESPYPRKASANGYAFWDNAVGSLWSQTGLSREVNRATSLRNFIKMLLYARGDLLKDFSQVAISHLDKSHYQQTAAELFHALMNHGIVLLNASLVYREAEVTYHARQWQPFIHRLLSQLAEMRCELQLILFGKIAKEIPKTQLSIALISEHPYNLSFITNEKVVAFFKPLDLLLKEKVS